MRIETRTNKKESEIYMKKIERYICEVCKTEYADKEKCEQCEKSHKTPRAFVESHYLPVTTDTTGYPERIDIRMSDDKIVKYKKIRVR